MPRFEGEEHHNVYTKDGDQEFTDEYKPKAVELIVLTTLINVPQPLLDARKIQMLSANVGTAELKQFQKPK